MNTENLNSVINKIPKHNHSHNSLSLPSLADSPTHTQKNDKLARSPEYIQWRLDVCEALESAGYEHEAELFETCCNHPRKKFSSALPDLPIGVETVWVCSEHAEHDAVAFAPTCDLRICPDCAHRQMARFAARYIPKARELQNQNKKGFGLRHIVLTTPYALEDDDAAARYDKIFDDVLVTLDSLLPQGWRKEQGFIVAVEFGEDGHKLHAHIIHYGQYIPKYSLTEAWKLATGGECEINFVRSLVGKTEQETADNIIEVVKYAVKFVKVDNRTGQLSYVAPELMPKLLGLLKGTRRVRSYGVFYNVGAPEESPFCCEACGAAMARIGVEHWQIWRNTGYLPQEWAIAKRGELDLILANKSSECGVSADSEPPPKQSKLPVLNQFTEYQ